MDEREMKVGADGGGWKLIGADGESYVSEVKGTLGGHRRSKIYGRLDCAGALRAIERGGPYPQHRVFFADEVSAKAAGYRPCAVCMPAEYAEWKAGTKTGNGSREDA